MKANVNVEFPCGYKYHVELAVGFLGIGSFETKDLPDECPLHGKNCPPK